MKTKQLFWGVLLIALGVLIFLNNIGQLNWEWDELIKLWPLFFVLWGISLMTKNLVVKRILISLTSVALALSIFASYKTATGFTQDIVWDNGHVFIENGDSVNEYSELYFSKYKTAKLKFHAGAGAIVIADTTSKLIYARTKGYNDEFDLNISKYDNEADVDFRMAKTRFSFNNINSKNKIEINLNPSPVWDLDIDVGAASLDLDLSKFIINNVKIEMGAASLHARLGNLSKETHFEVDAGASSINISIPENSGCEIDADVTLSSKDFKGFRKITSSVYRTDNFDNAVKKIYLNIKSGVSSVKVSRYAEKETW